MALPFVVLIGACLASADARALDPDRSITQFHHATWTLRDGMPSYVNALVQTPDGYLWIGAPSGLYRFDGVRVEAFGERLPGVAVVALKVTRAGDLWIGSAQGVSRLKHGRLTSFVTFGLDKPANVRHIEEGANGDIWVAADKVARFDGEHWQVLDSDWGKSENYTQPGGVWGLAVARDGVVWAKNLLGLYYLRPGSTGFVKAEGYAGSIIDFAQAGDGRLWTADSATNRFYALPDLAPASTTSPPPAQVGAAVPPGVLGRVMFDRDGALWCANSTTGGLYRVRSVADAPAVAEQFTMRDGLTSNMPLSLLEDQEGDIWVGTELGINRFAPANVVVEPSISIRIQGSDITAAADAVYVADGWVPPAPAVGHDVQTIYRITDGAPQALPLPIGNLTILNGAGSGGLLVGSHRTLLRLRNGVSASIALPSDLQGADLLSATQDGDDIWAVFGDRGLYRMQGDTWTRVAVPGVESIAGTRVRVDRQGAAWLIKSAGIKRLSGARLDEYGAADGLDIGLISFAIPDADGLLLGGQSGVARFDGGAFHTLSAQQAPFLRMVSGVVSDDVGGTWFHTTSGIYRVPTEQLATAFQDPTLQLDSQLFDVRDGLRSPATQLQWGGTAVRGPDGRLWFLNLDNVAWIDPHRLYRNPVPPPVSIQSLTANDRTLEAAAVRSLSAGTSRIQIDYTALSVQNPERVRFRYRLDGVDSTWVDAGGRRQAFYTRLEPGPYRFQVIAANNDDVWNMTGATLEFEIPPTFLQSGWFVLLCAALALLALWLAYSLRVRRIRAAMQGRHEERVLERERIARELHDTLLQGFHGLILRFQAVMESIPAGEPARAKMNAALERADEVLTSGRDRVRDLRTLISANDLAEALTNAAEAMPAGANVRFELVIEGTPRALHPIVAEELAAIGREAILNSYQHARARRVDADLTYDRRGLSMSIADDGVGIDTDVLAEGGRAGHFGLLGMRERAEKIKGKFTIYSRAGAGTTIAVTVPAQLAFAAFNASRTP